MESALDRFLRYVQIETTSAENAETVPSTPEQFVLARRLYEELCAVGLADATVDGHAQVTATLPDRRSADEQKRRPIPTLGFIAHMDTAPGVSGKNVRPQVVLLDSLPLILLNGTVVPEDDALKSSLGDTLVVSDGSTLLGADDKAGIAAIMTAVDRLANGRDANGKPYAHGKIRVCFTPDEEVGRGADYFDIESFGAQFAVTVDGNLPGEINRETFSAEKATISVTGRDIHPGSAKGVMVNATLILADLLARFPKDRAPETTEGYEPYIHPYLLNGSVGHASASVILRAFSAEEMTENRRILDAIAAEVQKAEPRAKIEIVYKEQYFNMLEKLRQYPDFLEKIERSVRFAGVEPHWVPVRGGTDGSQLTERGLPTPNLFTGGHNFHSVTEWLSVEKMEIAVNTLIHLAERFAKED